MPLPHPHSSMRPAIFLNKRENTCLKLTLNLLQPISPTCQKRVKWIQPYIAHSSRLVGSLKRETSGLVGQTLSRSQLQEKLPGVPAPAQPQQNNLTPSGISSMPSNTHGTRRIIELFIWVVFPNCVVSNFRFVKLFI